MPIDPDDFRARLMALNDELLAQGHAVRTALDSAVGAFYARDVDKARGVVAGDADIDVVDVRIEQHAVALLADIVGAGRDIPAHDLRMILTIVKVNNEMERIADLASEIAERVEVFASLAAEAPPKFRVMANSVIGILGNTLSAFAHMDGDAAQLVLATDDATEAFAEAIRHDIAETLARGEIAVDLAFTLNRVGACLARIADHCTNVAEQTIYVNTGQIVRHMGDKWTAPAKPDLGDAD